MGKKFCAVIFLLYRIENMIYTVTAQILPRDKAYVFCMRVLFQYEMYYKKEA